MGINTSALFLVIRFIVVANGLFISFLFVHFEATITLIKIRSHSVIQFAISESIAFNGMYQPTVVC